MCTYYSKFIKIHYNIFYISLIRCENHKLLTPDSNPLYICNLRLKINITTHLKEGINKWQHSRHQNLFWEWEKKKPDLEQYAVSSSTDATIRAASMNIHASLSLSLLVHVFLSIHQSNFVYERREFKWLNKQKKEKKSLWTRLFECISNNAKLTCNTSYYPLAVTG